MLNKIEIDAFKSIKSEIEPANFSELAGLSEKDKLTRQIYDVAIAKMCYEAALNCGHSFYKEGGLVYMFNGNYWQLVDSNDIEQLLSDVAIKMGVKPVQAEHYQFKESVYRQFFSILGTPNMEPDDSRVMINLLNGTYEISEDGGVLREARAEDFLKYQLSFDYDEQAQAPIFHTYLDEVLPDKSCQDVLAEYVGYIFTKRLKLEKIMILYGKGANGKSVFAEILMALVGKGNMTAHSLSELTKESSFVRADLQNVLVNYATEINGRMDTNIFKQLASNEPVSARRIFGQPFTMYDYGKLMFNCNELPKDIEQTDAFFRRFIVIPFLKSIPKEKQDPGLARRIIDAEMPGIFNWVLSGLDRLLKNKGFSESQTIQNMVETFRTEHDSVLFFLKERNYVPSHDPKNERGLSVIHQEYRDFCTDRGLTPCAINQFSIRIVNYGFEKKRLSKGNVILIEKKVTLKKVPRRKVSGDDSINNARNINQNYQ